MVLRQPICARIIIELGFDISFVFLLSRSSLTKLNISKENARRERKKERKEEDERKEKEREKQFHFGSCFYISRETHVCTIVATNNGFLTI